MIASEPWFRSSPPLAQNIDRLVETLERLSPTEDAIRDHNSEEYHVLSQLDNLLERSGKESTSLPWFIGLLLNYYRYPGYRQWLVQSYTLVYETPRWKLSAFHRTHEDDFAEGQDTIGEDLKEETGRDLPIGDNLLQLLLMHRNSIHQHPIPKQSVAVLRKAVAWWISNVLSVREDQFQQHRNEYDRIDNTDVLGRGVSFAINPAQFAKY